MFRIVFGFFILLTFNISLAATLEPRIAYNSGKFDEGNGSMATVNGASIGGRLGWNVSSQFSIGIDGTYSILEKEYTAAPRVTYPATEQQLGAFVAVNLNSFIVTSTFFLFNQIKFSTRDEELRGTAVKIGLSIPVISSARANIDYLRHNFKESIGSAAVLPVNADAIVISISYLL